MSRRLLGLLAAAALAAPLSVPSYATPGAWVPTLATTDGFDHVSIFPDGVAYAQTAMGYVKSTDFGVTWQRHELPAGNTELGPLAETSDRHVRFATSTIGYAYVTGTSLLSTCAGGVTPLARTTDGGTTWTPVCVPKAVSSMGTWRLATSPLAVGRDGRTVLLLGKEDTGPGCADERGAVFTSTDAGGHWTRAVLPPNTKPELSSAVFDSRVAAFVGYHARDPENCDLTGDSNAVVITRDGGRTWRIGLECRRGEPLCGAIGFVSANRLLVGRSDGSTLYTDDGGRRFQGGPSLTDARWQAAIDKDPEMARWFWVQGFSFAGQYGYASTRGRGTWRTADGGRSWTQEKSQDCEYYPFGLGDVSAASADRALVGGPRTISTRQPAPVDPGPCTPDTGQIVTGGREEGPVRRDGTLAR